jgi:predicted RNase H-like HicB family nuclease
MSVSRGEVNLSAYTVVWRSDGRTGYVGTVAELPGCVAVAASSAGQDAAIRRAIVLFWDDHPEVERRRR